MAVSPLGRKRASQSLKSLCLCKTKGRVQEAAPKDDNIVPCYLWIHKRWGGDQVGKLAYGSVVICTLKVRLHLLIFDILSDSLIESATCLVLSRLPPRVILLSSSPTYFLAYTASPRNHTTNVVQFSVLGFTKSKFVKLKVD